MMEHPIGSLLLSSFYCCLFIFFYPTKTYSVESTFIFCNFVIVSHLLVSTFSKFFSTADIVIGPGENILKPLAFCRGAEVPDGGFDEQFDV